MDRRTFTFTAGVSAAGLCGSAAKALAQAPAATAPGPSAYAPIQAPDPLATLLKPSQWKLIQDALDQADTHGLNKGDYQPPGMDTLLQSPDPGQRTQGGRMLINAFLRYAKDVRSGRLREDEFPTDWALRPPAFNPAPEFMRAVNEDRLAGWVASLPPPYAGYQGLRQALTAWRASANLSEDWGTIPEGAPLSADKPIDGRVPKLRHRLAALGYAVDANAKGWDESLTTAVQTFQKRHGMTADGVVAKNTLEALNVSPAIRERQILANLERWRWLPPTLPKDRVQVNIVAGLLTLFQNDAPTLSMRAVAGKVGNETPMLTSMIHSVVLNPPWNVPAGIAKNELYPKGQAYLARNGFRTINGNLQQKPGPNSALGRVKFDFNNPFAVYLHDTPSQSTFSRDERLASHGCVRLQNPRALAKALLSPDPAWTPEAVEAGIDAMATKRVPLPQQIAVFLLYWTAYAGADRQVNFRADRYGWDEMLLRLIERRPGLQQA